MKKLFYNAPVVCKFVFEVEQGFSGSLENPEEGGSSDW